MPTSEIKENLKGDATIFDNSVYHNNSANSANLT